jgi:hypothetical protein
MPVESPGWLPASEAVREYGLSYNLLRKLVADGVFTRGVFGAAKERPPIYVRRAELDAYKAGGVNAVAPVRAAFSAAPVGGA